MKQLLTWRQDLRDLRVVQLDEARLPCLGEEVRIPDGQGRHIHLWLNSFQSQSGQVVDQQYRVSFSDRLGTTFLCGLEELRRRSGPPDVVRWICRNRVPLEGLRGIPLGRYHGPPGVREVVIQEHSGRLGLLYWDVDAFALDIHYVAVRRLQVAELVPGVQ